MNTTSPHRYVVIGVSLIMIIRSAIVSSDENAAAYPAGVQGALLFLHIVLASSYDPPTCVEIMLVQQTFLIGMVINSAWYWHYCFFPLLFVGMTLIEGRHEAQIAKHFLYMVI